MLSAGISPGFSTSQSIRIARRRRLPSAGQRHIGGNDEDNFVLHARITVADRRIDRDRGICKSAELSDQAGQNYQPLSSWRSGRRDSARVLAQKLSENMGGQFYVENLPGAGGTIGAGTAAKAPADGHAILMINQDFIVQPLIKTTIPYDAFKSFAPVGLVATAPEMISVHPSVPAKDVKELIALLKANPGKYSYATPGYGTSPHLACERLFRISNGLDVVHVPFQGGGPAVQSTIAGHTQIIHIISPAVAPHLKEGTLRALAVASKVRSPAFPDVPTLEEAGVPNHEVAFWMGGVVPFGTPKYIVELLQAQFAKVMALPEIKQRLAVLGFEPFVSTPEEFAAHMKVESDKWRAVVRDANIKIE